MSIEELALFINNLNNQISQCKFCPENKIIIEIFSDTKKIFFKRKLKISVDFNQKPKYNIV
jgi:hypothetical protein